MTKLDMVSQGRVTGESMVQKFGRNTDIDTATDPEDIWDGGGIWVPPTTARVHNLVSSSAEDGAGGFTGALTVTVEGLDATGAVTTETVTMDGTTPAPTSNSYIIIHRMFVATAGTNQTNVGNITATAVTDATVTARITADHGQTLMAIYQIPTGKTGYLLAWYAAVNKSGGGARSADLRMMTKASGGAWLTKHHLSLSSTGSSYLNHNFEAHLSLPAGTIIKVQVQEVSGNDTDVSAGFDIHLVDA